MRALALGSLLAAIADCSSKTASTPPTVAPDAGTEAPDTGVAEAPCDPPAITFARSAVSITPTRDHHMTLVRDVAGAPYLYVLGGEQEDFAIVHSDVQRARIGPDGTLGAFESAGAIPHGRAGAGLAVVGDDVVLAGGIVGDPRTAFTDEILVARFDAGGRLDSWKAGPSLPAQVQHAAAVVVGRDVYVTGGTTGSDPAAFSVRTTVAADGTLSPLAAQPDLVPARSHHAAFVARGNLYLVGGLDKGPVGNPPSRSDVVRAKIRGGGGLDAWEPAGDLGSPLSISAAQTVGCSVLFLGGLDDRTKGGPFSDGILRGLVAADGTFQGLGPLGVHLTVKRGHVHQTPVSGKYMYSVGGRSNTGATLGTIDVGTIQ